MQSRKILYMLIALIAISPLVFIVIEKNSFSDINSSFNSNSVDSINYVSGEQVIGIYNRNKQFSDEQIESFALINILLDKYVDDTTIEKLLSEFDSDQPVLATIEISGSAGENSLYEIVNGKYDNKIKAICASLSRNNRTIYIRWNPEMEVPVHLYTWQYQSPIQYNYAFQYFSTLCKRLNPAIKIIWGTAGYPGVEEYWPGSDAVDLISITLNSKSELVSTAYPLSNNTVDVIRRKIHRMRFMNKPVLLLNAKKEIDISTLKKYMAIAVTGIDTDSSTIYNNLTPDHSVSLSATTIGKSLIGVYDPKKLLLTSKPVAIEHIFVDLDNVKNGLFLKDFNAALGRNHDVIVTVEPLIKPDTNVLTKVLNGDYDNEFREIYKIINVNQTVYLRFAHEMEIPIHRYPWQSQDPVLYIKAYRYFMNFENLKSNNIKRVWGPAGDRGSMEWWPGNDVVDYISIAIYGLPDKNITDPNQQESFNTIYSRKHYRMRFTNKPMFVTEFGVKGPDNFQEKWLEDAAVFINKHPEIYGVCYFNLYDNPKVWGKGAPPDWSISKKSFNHFVETLSTKR